MNKKSNEKSFFVGGAALQRRTDAAAKRGSGYNGFTLIEVIVVAVLLSVLAMGGFALFNMYANSARETSMYMKLQRQAEGLTDEITRRAREAAYVVAAGALPPASSGTSDDDYYDDDDEGNAIPVKRIDILNDSAVVSSFWFENGVMWEQRGGDEREFTIDGAPIAVDVENSNFYLWPGRKQFRMNITLNAVANNGVPYSLNIQKGAFRCRN